MKRGASPPRYNERSCGVSGAGAGAGLFSVECVWSDIVTLGRATNKKEAKRRAAAEMLSKLSGTKSGQGSSVSASKNVGIPIYFEGNCSAIDIECVSRPNNDEFYRTTKENKISKPVKEERMWLPNGNTTSPFLDAGASLGLSF